MGNKDKMYEDMEKMGDRFELFIQMPDGEEKDKLTENIRKMMYGESQKMDDEQRSKAKEQHGMGDEDLDEMENYAKEMSYGMDMMEKKFGEFMKRKYPSEAEEMVDDMNKFKEGEYRDMFREKAIDKNGKCTETEKKQHKKEKMKPKMDKKFEEFMKRPEMEEKFQKNKAEMKDKLEKHGEKLDKFEKSEIDEER